MVLRPVNRLGDRRGDSLEEVPGGDALRGVDDGVPQCGNVCGEAVQEGARDGGFASGFDAVEGEVAAGCGVGLGGEESVVSDHEREFRLCWGLDWRTGGRYVRGGGSRGSGSGVRGRGMSVGRGRG